VTPPAVDAPEVVPAPPVEPPTRNRSDGLIDALERLSTLHRSGELTDAEFHEAKVRLLAQ
jgi:hypothetical protein